MIGILLAILGLLLSPYGMFAIIGGLTIFLLLPITSAISGYKRPAHFIFWLAKQPIRRAAMVVSEHNELYFKQMEFDSLGVEIINLDGEDKEFDDPDASLHRWMGVPFALADELHGILFDPRHAAIGQRKHKHDQQNTGTILATEEEWEDSGISKWKPGVFEMPTKHELVDLSMVRSIIDGGEKATYPQRVENFYENVSDPLGDGPALSQVFFPIIAFGLTFGGIWLLSSQLGGGDVPDTSVSFGASLIAAMVVDYDTIKHRLKSIHWNAVLSNLLLIGVPVIAVLSLALFVNPIIGIGVGFWLLVGFSIIPMVALITTILPIGGSLSSLFMKMGFMSYNEPVFEWNRDAYHVRELSTLDHTGDMTWYRIFGKNVGFTYNPDEAWSEAERMSKTEVESMQGLQPNIQGSTRKTNIPPKYTPTYELQRGSLGGFVPSRVKKTKQYINSGIAMERFKNSGVGEKTFGRLMWAKEHYGGDDNTINKTTLYLTFAGGMIGAVMAILVFVL